MLRVTAIGLIWVVVACAVATDAIAQLSPNYPPMLLQVPFLPQVAPGDWANTKNCGQTCALMSKGYYQGFSPASQAITDADKWLAKRFNDSRYNDPNGYYTNFTNTNTLGILLSEYCGLRCGPASGQSVSAVLSEIQRGRPVIVGVRISNGRLVSSGGLAHWALAIGWNPSKGAIILNDPGSSTGRQIQYGVTEFDRSWANDGRKYAPVWR